MFLDDAVNHRKAEAGAFHAFGSEEGLENAVLDFFGNAAAGILDGNHGVAVPGGDASDELQRAWSGHLRMGGQVDGSALGHGIAGIDAEIHNDLFHLGGVCMDRQGARSQVHGETDILPDNAAQHTGHLPEVVVEIKGDFFEDLFPRKGEQLARQGCGLGGGTVDFH